MLILAWHVRAKTAAWYAENLRRTRDLPRLDVWCGDRLPEPTPEELEQMRTDHEELKRRAGR